MSKVYYIILLVLFTGFHTKVSGQVSIDNNAYCGLEKYINQQYPQLKEQCFWLVSLKDQKLYRIEQGRKAEEYLISGSKYGAGNLADSYKTPLGLHTICEKIGDGVPIGGILRSREYSGQIATIYTDSTDVPTDYVTTRIVRFSGDEDDFNCGDGCDSYDRYIYLHGTPEEGLLGKPASHGCIRVSNMDAIQLYNIMDVGDKVLILDPG